MPNYDKSTVPDTEIEVIRRNFLNNPDYFRPEHVCNDYQATGLHVLPDPFGPDCANLIVSALQDGKPFSAVRIGDGEANFLGFGAYEGTPNLDRHSVWDAVSKQKDQFALTETWFHVLRDLMTFAVDQSDLVGVLGLWRPTPDAHKKIHSVIERIYTNPGSLTGHWRGIDLMLQQAHLERFKGKTVASAHFYFGILAHLDQIIPAARHVYCVTSSAAAVDRIAANFPDTAVTRIPVGMPRPNKAAPLLEPEFFTGVDAELPGDMCGSLCLIGAGPWAEIYCAWVKSRGGVAVDLGSGFDLLAGETTRPVHHRVGPETVGNILRQFTTETK